MATTVKNKRKLIIDDPVLILVRRTLSEYEELTKGIGPNGNEISQRAMRIRRRILASRLITFLPLLLEIIDRADRPEDYTPTP